jgi:rod shape-determining protein MreD
LYVVVVAVALVTQVSLVDRLPLPGGGGLDLVLLIVLTLALFRGSRAGALIGFWTGLATDILPPADHVLGQYALVLCLVGYVAGRASRRPPGVMLVTCAACAVMAPLLSAGLCALLGDPRIDWATLAPTWAPMMVYNLVAVPLIVWLVAAVNGRRRAALVPVRVWRRV